MNARGASGRVLVSCDNKVLELVKWEVGKFSISCRIKNCEDAFVWVFTGVYGPCSRKDKEGPWVELGAIKGLWGNPWYVGGNFNVGRFPWNATVSKVDYSNEEIL